MSSSEIIKFAPATHQKVVELKDDTDWASQQDIPEEKANQTLKELGIETLNLSKIRGYRRVSEILRKVGMVEWERGRLVHRSMHLEAARTAMLDMILNPAVGAETKVAAASAINLICQTENKTAELDVTLDKLASNSDAAKSVGAGLPPIGLQVGIAISTPESVDKTKPVDKLSTNHEHPADHV